jgi:lipid A 3-O-deacylase
MTSTPNHLAPTRGTCPWLLAGLALALWMPSPATADPWPLWPVISSAPREGYLHAARASRAASSGVGVGWRAPAVDCVDVGYRCSLRVEAEVAHWRSMHGVGDERSRITQIGLTPLWRQELPRTGTHQWYVEAGTGVNFVGPLYRSVGRRFSTSLNFGTQLGVGLAFGRQREHELSLRIEHFSNAGLRNPNPGEDFLQLRYLRQL